MRAHQPGSTPIDIPETEDTAQSETAHAADPSQAAAIEGYRHRK